MNLSEVEKRLNTLRFHTPRDEWGEVVDDIWYCQGYSCGLGGELDWAVKISKLSPRRRRFYDMGYADAESYKS